MAVMTSFLASTPARARGDRPDRGGEADRLESGAEADLLARVSAGDEAALRQLYDRYGGSIYSLALRIVRDREAAEDVMQEVLLAIWRGAADYEAGRGSPRSWILAHAHHKSVDAVRRQRLRACAPLDERLADDRDIGEEAIRRATNQRVRAALNLLSPPQRQAIALAYYGGYTQQEIAARLGQPLGTVKTRMRDGLLKLRGLLAGQLLDQDE